jgi:hemoglobin-like flavoprotein
MLSTQSLPLIEATLPLVGERMPEIAKNFYSRMLTAHPELFDGLFSRSNQKNGTQQQALAGSIAVFASHLVKNPDTTPEAMLSRIAHKHVSLDIAPEQYDIVYKYLFEAIADELSDVITAEIAAAWTEVYWLMAHALIKMEKGLYAGLASDKPLAPWIVVKKQAAGTDAITFTLEPADDTPVTAALPGQYVSVTARRYPPGASILPLGRHRHDPCLHHQARRGRRGLPRTAPRRQGRRHPHPLRAVRRHHPRCGHRPADPGLGRHRLHTQRLHPAIPGGQWLPA